jgi:hypothetical protein
MHRLCPKPVPNPSVAPLIHGRRRARELGFVCCLRGDRQTQILVGGAGGYLTLVPACTRWYPLVPAGKSRLLIAGAKRQQCVSTRFEPGTFKSPEKCEWGPLLARQTGKGVEFGRFRGVCMAAAQHLGWCVGTLFVRALQPFSLQSGTTPSQTTRRSKWDPAASARNSGTRPGRGREAWFCSPPSATAQPAGAAPRQARAHYLAARKSAKKLPRRCRGRGWGSNT